MSRRDPPKCCRTCSEFNQCMMDDPKSPCTEKPSSDQCAALRMQHFCPAMYCKRRNKQVVDAEQEVMW